jgi:glutaredoxin
MKNKKLIVFTLEGCSYCDEIIDKLNNNNILFFEMNINQYADYWEKVISYTGFDFVPSIIIMNKDKLDIYMAARDFKDINELMEIIKIKFN